MADRRARARVLLFTSGPWEGGAGADTQLAASVADCMPDRDFLWFSRWPRHGPCGTVRDGAVPLLSRDGAPHVPERLQAALAGGVLARRTDLVHAILTIGGTYPLFSRLRRGLLGGGPVIHTVPGVMDSRLLERARPLGGVTVALSEATAGQLRAAGFGDVRVIPPTIPLERWPCRPRAPGPPVVLFAGHHDPAGGAREAIAAAGQAHRSGARFRLVLAMRGRPGQDERALARSLRALAAREGLPEVEVLGHVADMPGLLAATDVLLFTPRTLGGKADVPFIVLEALATGRPVVLSDLPQFAALDPAGPRAPVADRVRTGELLSRMLEQPRRWEMLARRGRVTVEERFGPDRFRTEYERLYQESLA
ncbi:glycosyltransferase family 4 protein [Streptomyces sp. SID7499]|uniref:D-inositol 3-phosphate glycosyltransferase n=1 Tax=Streptomyces sp. SID7499 TaxID=2706086 RepID=A0A6G3XAQ5_9ACTN|nr:glycosyltransferase family 4 protein [Streptomyces sp. SID7499]